MNTLRSRGFVAVVLSMGLTVAACSSESRTSTAPGDHTSGAATSVTYAGPEGRLPTSYSAAPASGKDFTIGYMDTYAGLVGFKIYETSAREEIESLGGRIIVKDDQLNVTNQVNNCATLLTQGVDAIILFPLDPKALTPCFTAAAAKGVKVVTLNTPVSADQELPPGVVTDIIQGFDQNAYLRAKAVAEAQPGSSYAILGLGVPVAAIAYYTQRQKYWADKFGLKYLGEADAQTDDATGASAAMSGLLGKYPQMGTVFAYNDNAALAGATVARASGKSKLLVLGSNGQGAAVDAVKSGRLFATVIIDDQAIGRNAAVAAVSQVRAPSTALPKFVTAPITLVTAANAASVTPVG